MNSNVIHLNDHYKQTSSREPCRSTVFPICNPLSVEQTARGFHILSTVLVLDLEQLYKTHIDSNHCNHLQIKALISEFVKVKYHGCFPDAHF